MKERLLELRKKMNLNQEDFGSRIELSKASISALEKGIREITERTIMLICSVYNVSENWLRNGEGQMFVEPDTFSLDDYANKKKLSSLELDIIKCYMDLDGEIRQTLMTQLKKAFDRHGDSNEKDNDAKREERSSLRVIAAHNDAEMTDEEKENMQKDIEDLKNL